ncbi:hypothetical protein ACFW9O_17795 [Streptomyces sp. NPDC059499]|uniref:hypothetical protein n=1 Tax=Streptomyces sp. NPDC059499 TaxID=3346852 RepID=UPI0036A87EED
MPLTADLGISAGTYQTRTLDLTTSEDRLSFRRGVHLTSGTGAGKADRVFHDQRTLAASATEDLDLAGVLLDAFGAAATFAKVKGLFISAAATNVNNVVIGAGTAPWVTLLNSTGTITLRPGASFGAMAGVADATAYAVTATTGDILKVTNSGAGTSVVYDIVIVGTSA